MASRRENVQTCDDFALAKAEPHYFVFIGIYLITQSIRLQLGFTRAFVFELRRKGL